jgi:hypothetical protein
MDINKKVKIKINVYLFFIFLLRFRMDLLVCIEVASPDSTLAQLQPDYHRSGEFPFLEYNKVLGCFG